MDRLATLAAERDQALKRRRKRVSRHGRLVFTGGCGTTLLSKAANIDARKLAVEAVGLLVRFPNARYNSDEHRQLRAALYRQLLALDQGARRRVIDAIMPVLVDGSEDRD